MKKLLLLLLLLAPPVLAQTNTPTITLTPSITPTPTRTHTPTPPPPSVTTITGLPAGTTVVDSDLFAVDKLVSAVRRTRRVAASEVLDYIEASNLTFTGTVTINNVIINPDGAVPTATDCDEAGEEDGRIFIDTTTTQGSPNICLCSGATGWICSAQFGDTIDDTELTAEDFGDWTCTGSEDGCTVDSSAITSTKVLDATLLEADLNISNSATAAFCLTSDGGTGFTWTTCASGAVQAGGSNTQVQYNASNVLSGDAGMTYNAATDVLTTVGGFVGPNVTSGANPGHTHTGGSGGGVAAVADGTGIDGTAVSGGTYTPTLDLTEINTATVGNGTTSVQLQLDTSGIDPIVGASPSAFFIGITDTIFDMTTTGYQWDISAAQIMELVASGLNVTGAVAATTLSGAINLEVASAATGIADDEVPVGTGANTLTYKAVPDSDGATQKLQYDTTTNAFSTGTDDDVPDAGDFGTATGLDTNGAVDSIALTGDVSSSGLTTTIGADKILESMLKAVDAPNDEECLTKEDTTGDFEWQTCAVAGSTAIQVPLRPATCQSNVPYLNWDYETGAIAPTVTCVTGTNTQKAFAYFEETTDECLQTSFPLHTSFTSIDAHYRWNTSATSGSVAWCTQIICVGDAETGDPAFPAQAAGNCVSDAAKGTTLQYNNASDTSITITGCAVAEEMYIRTCRDPNETGGVTDDLAASAALIDMYLVINP